MIKRYEVASGGDSVDMTPSNDGPWVRLEDFMPLQDSVLRAIIERECGPVQRISDLLWAIDVARAVERAHGIWPNVVLRGANGGTKEAR